MPDEETGKRKDIDMSNCKENAEFVKKFLDDDDWHYEMHDSGTAVVFTGGIGGFDGMYSSFKYFMAVGEDEAQAYVMFPVMPPCCAASPTSWSSVT